MIVIDTNVLLAAFRAELASHQVARQWLEAQLDQGEVLHLPIVVRVAFLRLSTRTLGPIPPAPLANAAHFLTSLPTTDAVPPSDLTMRVLGLCQQHRLSSDGTVDAWIAAEAMALGAALATFDRGFAKYAPTLHLLFPGP